MSHAAGLGPDRIDLMLLAASALLLLAGAGKASVDKLLARRKGVVEPSSAAESAYGTVIVTLAESDCPSRSATVKVTV